MVKLEGQPPENTRIDLLKVLARELFKTSIINKWKHKLHISYLKQMSNIILHSILEAPLHAKKDSGSQQDIRRRVD